MELQELDFSDKHEVSKDFDVLESEQSEPGTVMVIEQEGKIEQSNIYRQSCGCYIKK